jgi:hypothetical protein
MECALESGKALVSFSSIWGKLFKSRSEFDTWLLVGGSLALTI